MQTVLMDTKETARFLGISYNHLSRMRSEGKGPPAIKIGRVYKYRQESVERWLAEQEATMPRAEESSA